MRKKLMRIVAGVLFACMVAGSMPAEAVYGADVNAGDEQSAGQNLPENEQNIENADDDSTSEETEIQEQPDENDSASSADSSKEITNDEVASEEVSKVGEAETEDIEAKESGDIEAGEINFVYVESPYLATPDTQRIVFAFDQVISGADTVTLTVEDEAGNQEEWDLSRQTDNLYLFEKEYTGDAYTGTYHVVSLNLYGADERIIALEDAGVEAEFGVNQEYEGMDELKPIDGAATEAEEAQVGASVVTIDENGVPTAQDSIADALRVVSAENVASNGISTFSAAGNTSARSGNIVVALDPGHDAWDAGARGNGLKEEELTLKIANYCKEELEQYSGVSVYMTRTTAACPYGIWGVGCIEKRVQAAANAGAQIFVSFHLNAATSSSANGAEVIVPNKSWKAEVGSEGAELGQAILDELVKLGLSDRGIYSKDTTINERYPDGSISDYFGVQIYCKEQGIPGLIVEHAFISNSGDANSFLKTEAGLKKLGVADATGIAKYLGLSKGHWEYIEGQGWKYYTEGKYASYQWLLIGGYWYFFDSNEFMHTGWLESGGKWYYLGAEGDGAMKTGWQYIDNEWYYFHISGAMQTGWQLIGGKWYYMNACGVMQTGWLRSGDRKLYLGPSGDAYIGWHTIDGKKYYFDANGYMLTGRQVIGGVTYIFADTGELLEKLHKPGWEYDDGKWYYYGTDGRKETGWQLIGGKWYYMNSDGAMQTGWEKVNGEWYYMNSDGVMLTSWQYISGSWYYMNVSGVMQTGWLTSGKNKLYLGPNGNMYIGWHTIDGEKYYFDANGYMLTGRQVIGGDTYIFADTGELLEELHKPGWEYDDGKWYYYGTDGRKETDWQLIGGKWYYMNSDGVMQTGWVQVRGTWYYLNNSGAMMTGWQISWGNWYYLNNSGAMVTGWKNLGGKWYYMNSDGVMQTGWEKVNGEWYYMNSDGVMLSGWQYISGSWYYMNGSGVMQTGWLTSGKNKLYLGPNGNMYIGWHEINGNKYYFDVNGYMLTGRQVIEGVTYIFADTGELLEESHKLGWEYIEGKWYYYGTDGRKTTGWQLIQGIWYYMDASGVMQTGWIQLGSTWYYLDENGAMLTGWQMSWGCWYYLEENGSMVTGWKRIDGKWYYFNEAGTWIEQDPVEGTYLIQNASSVTIDQMVKYFRNSGHKYPKEALAKGGAPDIETFCKIFYEEAQEEGIAVEVAYTQSMLETGWLQFGGAVKIEQFNFAGLGAVDSGGSGADFSSYGEDGVRMGVRAQMQHLKAYASFDSLKNVCVDPRFHYVKRGSAQYVEWLGQKENPNGYGWATATKYGVRILDMIQDLKGM